MSEILVSHPERLWLARASSSELPETTLIVPDLSVAFVEYFRFLVMAGGDVRESALAFVEAEPSQALLEAVMDVLRRRKKTHVVFASESTNAPCRLVGGSSGLTDASALSAVLCAARAHTAQAQTHVDVLDGERVHRITATFEGRLWRCRLAS